MNKKVVKWNDKKYYLIGTDGESNYYLEEAHFDCDWYWGGGYVVTFTNTTRPERSKDFDMFTHFDTLIFNKGTDGHTAFKEFFKDSVMSEGELWRFLELMKSFYIARSYSDMIYRGGSNYTKNDASSFIKCDEEYKRINEVVIPEIMKSVYKILGGDK